MSDIQPQNQPPAEKAMTIAELHEIVEAHKKDLYVYQEKVEAQGKTIEQQQVLINGLRLTTTGETKLTGEATKKPTIPEKHVSHNKKNYKWTRAQFNLPGRGIVTAEDAALDPKIVAEILAIQGQTHLVEQA